MTTEKVLEHAEITACYFRSLIDKGLSPNQAISLTCSYIQYVVLTDQPKPPEPWEKPT